MFLFVWLIQPAKSIAKNWRELAFLSQYLLFFQEDNEAQDKVRHPFELFKKNMKKKGFNKRGRGHDRTSHLCCQCTTKTSKQKEWKNYFKHYIRATTTLVIVTALTTFSMYVSNGQALCHVNLSYLQETRDRYYNRITPTTGGGCGLNQMGTI